MRFLILILASVLPLSAADIYFAQSSAGANNGADCADAYSVTRFNTDDSNWTPGNTLHLCGTFTGTAGQTMLTVQASGSIGNPITILFESGASLQAPYWGAQYHGAIDSIGMSNIVINGGANGFIENTANGTALANQAASQGIYVSHPTNILIENLTILAIYANGGSNPAATDTGGTNCNDIYVYAPVANLTISNNVLMAARAGVRVDFGATSIAGLNISGNSISDHCWGIMVGAGSGGETTSGINLNNNTITNWTNWQCPSASVYCDNSTTDAYHTDGMILYSYRGSPITANIYNNYIYGTLGSGSPTAFIYCTEGGGPSGYGSSCNIFNNLLVETSGRKANWLLSTGSYTAYHQIYNNTLIGQDNTAGVAMVLSGNHILAKNNIIMQKQYVIQSYESSDTALFDAGTSWDYNDIYSVGTTNIYSVNIGSGGGPYYTEAQWKALQSPGYDANSIFANPLVIAANGKILQASPARTAGANLASVGIAPLLLDAAGNARPSSPTLWDIGAYQYFTSSQYSGAFSGGPIQ